MDPLDEAVEQVLRGETSAFRKIVDATSTRLVRMSARIMGNLADAEDIVQDAYVKAYRSLISGQFDRRSSVSTWLYRIVVNATIDAKRSRTRKATSSDVMLDKIIGDGGDAEARFALTELSGWLGELPSEQQAALLLKAVEGFSSAEAAAIVGCTEGAIEQRLVRARAALRNKRGDS